MVEFSNGVVVVGCFHANKVLQNDPPLSSRIDADCFGSLELDVERESTSGALYIMASQ